MQIVARLRHLPQGLPQGFAQQADAEARSHEALDVLAADIVAKFDLRFQGPELIL